MKYTLSEETTRICVMAIQKFGADNQLRKLEEELAELMLALRHFPAKSSAEDIAEEGADVMVLLCQLGIMFPSMGDVYARKMKRLEGLVSA